MNCDGGMPIETAMPPNHKPPQYILTAFSQAAIALGDFRRGGNPGELADDVAELWRKTLGVKERGMMLRIAISAVEPRDALHLRNVLVELFPVDAGDVPPFEV